MGKLSKKVSEDDKYTLESLQEIIKITQANIQNRLAVIDDLLKKYKMYEYYPSMQENIHETVVKERAQLDAEIEYLKFLEHKIKRDYNLD